MAIVVAKKVPPPAKFVELGKSIEKARQRVYRVGIELEGGWTKLPKGVALTHDGSVVIDNPGMSTAEAERYLILRTMYRNGGMSAVHMTEYNKLEEKRQGHNFSRGELPSPPIEVESIEEWMKIHYPDLVNATCGMHVHMSFRSALTYQQLMRPDYQATILEYVRKWATKEGLDSSHPIWPRLDNKSRYCQHKFWADKQARQKGKGHDQNSIGHRYTAINYCYGRYQTIECRLLPMMDKVELGIRAVKEIVSITNGFLHATRQREPIERASVMIEDDLLRENFTERLL